MLTLDQIIQITQPNLVSGTHCQPTGKVTDDSRKVEPGDIFIAVRGFTFDSHKFIPQVLSMGVAVVISEEFYESDDVCILVVGDTRKILGPLMLAYAGNPQKQLQLIGVTGTNGKTTVSTLIWQALTSLNVKTALVGTVEKAFGKEKYTSLLTTPGAAELASDLKKAVDLGCTHFVMEVSSHALHQHRTNGLNFDVGIFTNLSHDHLDYHHSIDEYANAKKLLFDNLHEDAVAIVNTDDIVGERMISDCRANIWDLTLTTDDYRIAMMDASGLLIDMDGIYIKSPLTGKFNAYNVAQAFLACIAIGLSPRNVAQALESCAGAAGRMENVSINLPAENGPYPMVFVDFAHTPDALENVLKTLQEVRKAGQVIHTVFGCGGDRDRAKRPEMAKIAARYSHKCIVTSDNPRFEDPDAIIDEVCNGFSKDTDYDRFTDRKVAIKAAIKQADANTIVLVAGKGHETYQEIKGNRYPMDDREICLSALKNYKIPVLNKEGR